MKREFTIIPICLFFLTISCSATTGIQDKQTVAESRLSRTAATDCSTHHYTVDNIRQQTIPIAMSLSGVDGIQIMDPAFNEFFNFGPKTAIKLSGECVGSLDDFQISSYFISQKLINKQSADYALAVNNNWRLLSLGNSTFDLSLGHPKNIDGRFRGATAVGAVQRDSQQYLILLGLWEETESTILLSYLIPQNNYHSNDDGLIVEVKLLARFSPKLKAAGRLGNVHGLGGSIYFVQEFAEGLLFYGAGYDFSNYR